MDNNIVRQDLKALLDSWMAAEQKGVKFPVPFDAAWQMAGYGRKSTAKRDGLKGLKDGVDYILAKASTESKSIGRPPIVIWLSVKTFQHLQGKAIYRSKAINSKKTVYIMQCSETKVIKIGISHDPLARLSALQVGHPFPLSIVRLIDPRRFTAEKIEKELHKALDDFRLCGEWFDGIALQLIGGLA
jgi:hypothetical protein